MEAQKKRRQQEEVLTLRELRRTVDALRAESQALEDQKRAVRVLRMLCCMHCLHVQVREHMCGTGCGRHG